MVECVSGPRLNRYTLFLVLFLLATLCPVSAKPHPGVSYVKMKAAGVPIHLVDVNLQRDDLVVRPVVVPTGHRQKFASMVKKHRPVAAVNGTFFDTTTNITVANLVSDGRLLSEGMMGSNLVFGKDGRVSLLSSSRNLGRYKDWSDVDFAVGGGPTLLTGGEFFMNPASEGFRDPSLFRPRPRSAIGVTEKGHLRMVVVTQGVSLWKLAHVMKELNCVHAINLDGGTSTGLSVGGKTMVRPGRKLTNMIGIFASHMEPAQTRAVQVAESRALGHYNKAQQLLSQGKYRLARSQMRQAVAKAPEQAGFWHAAGVAELKFGNQKRALVDFHKASDLYLKRGDLVKTREIAEKILQLKPEHVAAHLLCGESKVEQGLDEEANAHLKFVLETCPGHPKATRLMEVLQYRKRASEELKSSGLRIQEALVQALS